MSATIDITEAQATDALAAFLLFVLPVGTQVVSGQQNLVPMPLGTFIVITSILYAAMEVPERNYDRTAGLSQSSQAKDWRVQLDVYGPGAADNASMLATAFRSTIATEYFDAQSVRIQTLYAEEPRNANFINESSNYEDRWTLDIHLQVTPTVSVSQQFATQLAVGVHEVDQAFPP